ncbi:RAVE protein 1 C terminal-domain-containing protein [Schizophyllum commune]
MLDLQQSILGSPPGALQHLTVDDEALVLYPSADSVVILDARTLAAVRVLAFWEAFPVTRHSHESVACVSVDPSMKIIVASMNTRVAAWSLSGSRPDAWKVHSALALPPEHIVTALDTKSGLLAVGTQRALSVYTLILENDLPTWSQKWTVAAKAPFLARFAPSLMYIATASKSDNVVRTYSLTTGRLSQSIPHPRPVTTIVWRYTQASSRDDLILYTVTADAVLRVFVPVLDAPQSLQLHASLDLYSSVPFSVASIYSSSPTSVFCLNRSALEQALERIVDSAPPHAEHHHRLREMKEEAWDLFLRAMPDGSLVVSAIANIDRRPPTLLRQFTLQHSAPGVLPNVPKHLYILPQTGTTASMTLISTPPLRTFALRPALFFGAEGAGLDLRAEVPGTHEDITGTQLASRDIVRFIRTPEGRGVCVIRGSAGEVWSARNTKTHLHGPHTLSLSGTWDSADFVVPLDGGRNFVTYHASDSVLRLHSHHPHADSLHAHELKIPTIHYLFSMPSTTGRHDSLYGIAPDGSILHIHVDGRRTLVDDFGSETGRGVIDLDSSQSSCDDDDDNEPCALSIHCHAALSLPEPPALVRQVDPMAWGLGHPWTEHDVLLSVSKGGDLAFWVPEAPGTHGWRCTGEVRTGRKGITKARCSSAKKTALITPTPEGAEELTIWDSHESEFASGLEFRRVFDQAINDLDWTATPDMQSILAVGFLHHVELLCQQRMTYFDEGPGWAMCWRVDIGSFIPHPISDSIWLANGALLVGAGHQMLLYGQAAAHSPDDAAPREETLFEFAARSNGPLPDYHPQMLLQCLLWDKVELVKDIIVNLAKDFERRKPHEILWHTEIPLERFLSNGQAPEHAVGQKKRYVSLFDQNGFADDSEEEGFSRKLVARLLEALERNPLPYLTPSERAHLVVLIQTTLEIDEARRALDSNGLRYLISMRSFYIHNSRASAPSSPSGNEPPQTGRRERLRYRDMIWAYHSECQQLLLDASKAACGGKMTWADARALGVPIWLTSQESLRSEMESIARNEYMAGESRDPTACSLFYFALGKVKLVHGLWRTAAWHKEQAVMLKFLANDFSEHRWKTAALKNAYALLSKRRFEYAAAFFLLGGALKDAVAVCVKQLNDFQLAVALARIVENSNDGPVLRDILNNIVLPKAFREGNRWLAGWAFWLLHRRDLAVRILVTPLQELARELDIRVDEIGEPHYDDTSLALLFAQLRSKTLQAAKGASEISGRLEFNFVLQIARVFSRMGCHILALDLVRSWSFERPAAPIRAINGADEFKPPASPVAQRSHFHHTLHHRRSSMIIDMDIPSSSPSPSPDVPTPIPEEPEKKPEADGDLQARKAGLGSLMQTAKKDVTVPEFDINSFF